MRMRFRNFGINVLVISILIPLFYVPRVWGLTPEEVLTRYQNRMKGLKSYSVETVEKGKTIGPYGMEESSSHTRTLVKGKKRYSEIAITRHKDLGTKQSEATGKTENQAQQTEENQIIQVFDGTISWFYDTGKKEVKKVDFSKLPANIQEKIRLSQDNTNLKLPEGLEFHIEEKTIQERTEGKGEMKRTFYVLTSKNTVTIGGQKYEKIILWIDAKENLPFKVEMHGKIIVKIPQASNLEIQTQVVQKFKNWELNPDIPDSRFVFAVPEGVKVKDVTEETGGIYERYMKSR